MVKFFGYNIEKGLPMKEASTEKVILTAARTVFTRKGKDGARMQEIADEAGVNKMLLHYYFRSKEKLFHRVVEEIIEQVVNSVVKISAQAERFEDFLRTFIDLHIDFLRENHDMLTFLLWEAKKDTGLVHTVLGKFSSMGGTPLDYLAAKIHYAVQKEEIRPVEPIEFVLNIASLDIFPFIVLPPIASVVNLSDSRMDALVEKRKKEIFRLLWNDIKINNGKS